MCVCVCLETLHLAFTVMYSTYMKTNGRFKINYNQCVQMINKMNLANH